ncbi:conserved hypothetical protein [Ricinus communis]|uniref:Uncharacterized protein n=1 Tax=Ricinus communis TaxID=3988 RepID=B9TPC1_RICCO|nr:conserved hypothetical protein [Ricinus communis]
MRRTAATARTARQRPWGPGATPERSWCCQAMDMTPAWSSRCRGCGRRRRALRYRCGCARMRPTACSRWSSRRTRLDRAGPCAASSRAGTIHGRRMNSCPCKSMFWTRRRPPPAERAQTVFWCSSLYCTIHRLGLHAGGGRKVCMLSYAMAARGCG